MLNELRVVRDILAAVDHNFFHHAKLLGCASESVNQPAHLLPGLHALFGVRLLPQVHVRQLLYQGGAFVQRVLQGGNDAGSPLNEGCADLIGAPLQASGEVGLGNGPVVPGWGPLSQSHIY